MCPSGDHSKLGARENFEPWNNLPNQGWDESGPGIHWIGHFILLNRSRSPHGVCLGSASICSKDTSSLDPGHSRLVRYEMSLGENKSGPNESIEMGQAL